MSTIDVGSDCWDGINFHERFDEQIVNEAVCELHTAWARKEVWCYCLKLEMGTDNRAFFRPYGQAIAPSGETKAVPHSSVPLSDLVETDGTWNLIEVRGGEASLARRTCGAGGKWHVQIRLHQGKTYVGYLIALGVADPPPEKDEDYGIRAAFYRTKCFVRSLIDYHKFYATIRSGEFNDNLTSARQAVASHCGDLRPALRHVADMLTAHFGAGWNRAACYVPVGDRILRCLWAQGGDVTPEWSEGVQRPLGEQVHDMAELIRRTYRFGLPNDDRYLATAATDEPVELLHASEIGRAHV